MTEPKKFDISGSVMDGVAEKGGVINSSITKTPLEYKVCRTRWVILAIFCIHSGLNSMQWCQYAIIQDAVAGYYGVTSRTVYWTSLIFMLMYIPLVFPASWLLSKTVRFY